MSFFLLEHLCSLSLSFNSFILDFLISYAHSLPVFLGGHVRIRRAEHRRADPHTRVCDHSSSITRGGLVGRTLGRSGKERMKKGDVEKKKKKLRRKNEKEIIKK